MSLVHKVKRGDCISSIALRYGFAPDTLWQHPGNTALRAKRADPNILLEGDEIFVPDLRLGEVEAVTARRHRFRRVGVPEVFRARFLDWQGRPRAGLAYRFAVDGAPPREGTLDADGWLKEWIPPDGARAEITLLDRGREERHEALLGHLDPVTEITGVQARLNNLGYRCGPESGELDARTRAALASFQQEHGLEATGEIDDATRGKLAQRYGA
ncbi:MAG: peptidoglycan-binding protein [Minicystis sp.]